MWRPYGKEKFGQRQTCSEGRRWEGTRRTSWEDGGLKWCIYSTKNTKDASKPKVRGREGFPYSFQREHGAADTQISKF